MNIEIILLSGRNKGWNDPGFVIVFVLVFASIIWALLHKLGLFDNIGGSTAQSPAPTPPHKPPPPKPPPPVPPKEDENVHPLDEIEIGFVKEYIEEFAKRNHPIKEYIDDATISANFHNGFHNDYKDFVKDIMRRMGIIDGNIVLKIYPDIDFPKKEAAAFVSLPENMPPFGSTEFRRREFLIHMKRSVTAKYDTFVYSVAHEISHIVLHSIDFPKKDSEITTDLFVMVKGFGRIMETGKTFTDGSGNKNECGYLRRKVFEYAKVHLDGLKEKQKSLAFDLKSYDSIDIGTQTWMKGNLKVRRYQNGDLIPEAQTEQEWKNYCNQGVGCLCYYDCGIENGYKFGMLYNRFALTDSRRLVVDGWHIPHKSDFEKLLDFLGRNKIAGEKMYNRIGWSGLGSGFRGQNGAFNNINNFTGWWCSTIGNDGDAWVCYLRHDNYHTSFNTYSNACGFSVRCIKNNTS